MESETNISNVNWGAMLSPITVGQLIDAGACDEGMEALSYFMGWPYYEEEEREDVMDRTLSCTLLDILESCGSGTDYVAWAIAPSLVDKEALTPLKLTVLKCLSLLPEWKTLWKEDGYGVYNGAMRNMVSTIVSGKPPSEEAAEQIAAALDAGMILTTFDVFMFSQVEEDSWYEVGGCLESLNECYRITLDSCWEEEATLMVPIDFREKIHDVLHRVLTNPPTDVFEWIMNKEEF